MIYTIVHHWSIEECSNVTETREQIGGYFLIDAKDLDETIAIANRIPSARKGTVEIRPIVELLNLPWNNAAQAVCSRPKIVTSKSV